MVRYLTELTLAPSVFSTLIQNPHDRAQALRPAFEAFGSNLIDYYFAVGSNTVYTISEVSDTLSAEAFTMAILAGGAATAIKVTAILTSAEAVEAMKMARAMAYRPPSS